MNKPTVFIEGSYGTTGLRILERLGARDDISLLILPDEVRRDISARREAINSSDVAILCLPDDAAKEAVLMTENPNTVIIDASTAHRTNPEFIYGFPELGEKFYCGIGKSKRIAVPGCHACGFIALVKPVIDEGVLSEEEELFTFSVTGYSGGGKKMIEQYTGTDDSYFKAPRQYALGQTHKHLPEMTYISGIKHAPVFCPVVSDFYSGMHVTVPLFKSQIKCSVEGLKEIYKNKYNSNIVFYSDKDENGFASAAAYSGTDAMEISVKGNDERILLTARYDNLGKGASGAAVECLNLAIGAPADKSLVLHCR